MNKCKNDMWFHFLRLDVRDTQSEIWIVNAPRKLPLTTHHSLLFAQTSHLSDLSYNGPSIILVAARLVPTPSAGGEMGIRFYCPNGHRLNVKDFLAGKRGICPHCEARFRIPPDSEIPRGSPKIKPGSAAEMGTSGISRRRSNSAILTAAKSEKPVSALVRPKSDEKSDLVEHDPVDVSPESVWYVRPPAGGQYGPARGEVVRRWVAEGRVSADSLVWREGWADWQLAGPLFPGLAGLNAIAFSPESESDVTVSRSAEKSSTSPALPILPKKPGRSRSVIAVVGLVILIIVLSIGLVTVLILQS